EQSEHRPAAGPAPALNRSVAVSRVIVRQLFTLADVPRGADPDRIADDLRIAVRLARVIDVSRDVSADRRIAHVKMIQLEAPDPPSFQIPLLAPEAFAAGDLLACIVDDARVFRDGMGGKHAPAGYPGTALLNRSDRRRGALVMS